MRSLHPAFLKVFMQEIIRYTLFYCIETFMYLQTNVCPWFHRLLSIYSCACQSAFLSPARNHVGLLRCGIMKASPWC